MNNISGKIISNKQIFRIFSAFQKLIIRIKVCQILLVKHLTWTSICALNSGISNEEREVQDMGDDNMCIHWTIYNVFMETLMDEDDFDTGKLDGLQNVEQEDPALRNEWKLAARERPRTSGEEHERTLL